MAKEKLNFTDEPAEEVTSVKPNYESEILGIIRGDFSPKVMQNKLEDYHGNDIAQVMDRLSVQERKKLCRVSTVELLAETFEHLDEETAGAYLDEMPLQKAAKVISELETDTAASVLHAVSYTHLTLPTILRV